MNRIDAAFSRKALVIYATAGDRDADESVEVFVEAARAGADILEIGIPFSDPTADGPAIQAASRRALAAGMTVAGVLDVVERVRAHTEAAIVLFGYANPFLQYGAKKFAKAAAAAGADGVLTVDLPPEEDDWLAPELAKQGLHSIRLITPTSTPKRMKRAAKHGGGFLYYVSVTGVTGGATGKPEAIQRSLEQLRTYTDLPVVVGFGISTREDAREISEVCDGIVVGSALVRRVAETGSKDIARYVQTLRAAID